MILNFLHMRSIKARATLFTLVVFVASIWTISLYASSMLKSDMQHLIGDQQFANVSFTAEKLNEQLNDRLKSLEGVAAMVNEALLNDPQALQNFLEQRPSFKVLFNGGHFITDVQGTALASIPVALGRVGLNFMDKEHVATALRQGKTNIGKPTIGKVLKMPVIAMAAPIRNHHGQVIGALIGVTDLSRPSFFDNITQQRNSDGANIGYLLISPKHGLFVTATDKTRIMQPLPSPGVNLMHDKYMQGHEGFGVAVSSRGVEELSAAKSIPVAGWFLVAALPTTEAFAPIAAMHLRMVIATLLLTLVAGALTWWMLRRELLPLSDAARALSETSDSGQMMHPLPVQRQDEVGTLVGAFNRLLNLTQRREEALRSSEKAAHEQALALALSEQRLSTLLDDTKIHMWAFDGTRYTYLNKQWFDYTGQDPSGIFTAERWTSVVHPDDLPKASGVWLKHWETKTEHDNYFRLRRHDGVYRDFHCHTLPVFDEHGVFQYFQGFNLDITERKGMEDSLRLSEEKYRQLIENSHDIIYTLDAKGVFTFASPAWTTMLGHPLDQVLGHSFTPFVHEDDLQICFNALQTLFQTGERQSDIRYRVKHLDGSWRWHSSNAVPVKNDLGQVIGFEGNAKDITEQIQTQKLEIFRSDILELLTRDAPLERILEALVLGLQKARPAMLCSVMLLSADRKHLEQCIAPGLPDFYNQAVEGIEIGLGVGSCGTAAFKGERVIVQDIQTHPYWVPYKALAAQACIGSCWSEPIRAASGRILGTFALYHRAPRTPDSNDLRLIEQSAKLASIAIEKSSAASALRTSEQRLELAVTGAQEGIWDLNLITGELYHSPQMAQMLGYTESEMPAARQAWDAITDPEDIAKFKSEMGKHFKNPGYAFDVQVRLRHKNGTWHWMQSRGQATRNDAGRAIRFAGTQFDVTERKKLEDQVRQLAFFDALTGLPNRRMLDDRLSQAMAASKRSGLYGALMFLDLDNFKPLNDAHGHEVGDLLLTEVAHRLSSNLREMDTVARFGGDEFVVMLSELVADKVIATEQARGVAEKIRASVAAPYQLAVSHPDQPDETVEHHCSVSIGVVMFVNHEFSQSDLMKWADAAMYQAKDSGRNAICFFAGGQ